MEKIILEKIDSVYMRVECDSGIKQELKAYFSFFAPNYQFNPKFKNKMWDGRINLFTPQRPYLYVGLLGNLAEFCEEREYKLIIPSELQSKEHFDEAHVLKLAKELGESLTPRDYQIQYVLNALNNSRSISLSPTSSGKSYILALIQQHYFKEFGLRTLIIVPTIQLVYQMQRDFISYGVQEDQLYVIKGGIDKNTKSNIVISTYQSLIDQPEEWFNQFGVVLGDEAHLFQAKSLVTIMEKLKYCDYRFGFTGTISSESKVHKLVLTGLFGPIKKFVSTKNLMDSGTVADFKVKALILSYPKEIRKAFKQGMAKVDKLKKYPLEREFLAANERRNKFIQNLVWSLKDQNNLILFDLIEKHGDILAELLPKEGRILHYIHGAMDGKERDKIVQQIENDPLKRHDILASSKVFSTGVSLKRLDNAIFVSSSKSEVKVLQSIGRLLRKGNGSDDATLFDIADDLSSGGYDNYTLQHFKKRVEYYSQEQFPFKVYTIDLE